MELAEPKLILIFCRYYKCIAGHAGEWDTICQVMKQTLYGIELSLPAKITKSIFKKMQENSSTLNIVRIGSYITFSSLKEIGNRILESFQGIIDEIEVSHHDAPFIDSIDAYLLTTILHEEFGGHTLGITDADLKTNDEDEFYNSIFGGKNPQNDVAVVSTSKLGPPEINSKRDYDLYIDRTLKVSLHEVGHNFGLTDHGSYKVARNGSLCPMSKGEFNKFGYWGYVRAIIDGRGLDFCDECAYFLSSMYGHKSRSA